MPRSIRFFAATLVVACAPTPHQLYDGPPRPQSDVAIVKYKGGEAQLIAVDGKLHGYGNNWDGAARLELLPGRHRLTMTPVTVSSGIGSITVTQHPSLQVEFIAERGRVYTVSGWSPVTIVDSADAGATLVTRVQGADKRGGVAAAPGIMSFGTGSVAATAGVRVIPADSTDVTPFFKVQMTGVPAFEREREMRPSAIARLRATAYEGPKGKEKFGTSYLSVVVSNRRLDCVNDTMPPPVGETDFLFRVGSGGRYSLEAGVTSSYEGTAYAAKEVMTSVQYRGSEPEVMHASSAGKPRTNGAQGMSLFILTRTASGWIADLAGMGAVFSAYGRVPVELCPISERTIQTK